MPKITQVESQKKNSRRFNIFLDGEFAFGADEDLVVNYRLIPGKIISENDLNQLIQEAEIGKRMEKMYNLFSLRQRSEKEISDYLKVKSQKSKVKTGEGISQLVIDQLVDKLKQRGMINDLEFARSWVEGRRRSKQKSNRALKLELLQKGINREIIEEVVNRQPASPASTRGVQRGESSVVSEEELAKEALQKKMKSWRNLPEIEFKKKAYDYLTRRGFNYSDIKTAVENVLEKE